MDSVVPQSTEKELLSLNKEFLLRAYNNIWRSCITAFFGMILIAIALFSDAPNQWVVVWLLTNAAWLFLRAYLIASMFNNASFTDQQRLQFVICSIYISALLMSSALLFFPFISLFDAVIITLVMSALVCGGVVSNGGLLGMTIPYTTIILLCLAAAWSLFPHTAKGDEWKAYLLSSFIIFVYLALMGIAKDLFSVFSSSVAMRQKYAETNAQLSDALQESQSANAAKTRFLAAASHDLRQPVHTLSLLMAALINRNEKVENSDERVAEITATMGTSLQSLAEQLDSLLDISKLDAGIVEPNLVSTDVIAIVQSLEREFLPIATEKNLALRTDFYGAATALTDSVLLERLLRNLLANAIKYTEVGCIDIIVSHDDALVIRVIDSGIGIASNEQSLIFEEFYQINNQNRDRNKGLGLGLSIVERLCTLLNIRLTMSSQLGQGTEFSLHLNSSSQSAIKRIETERQYSLENRTILVIDDEADVRLATRSYLEELGCRVVIAESIQDAISEAKKNSLDLVIADLRLKDNENGIDALKQIRTVHPDVPALLITGDTASDQLREASKANAKLLHKPVTSRQLQLALQEALNEMKV